MSTGERLQRIAPQLDALIGAPARTALAGALERGEPEGLIAGLEALLEGAEAARTQQARALAERTLQLELALGVLSERDKVAAEQSEWDFATDLQTAGLPNEFPPYPDRREFDIYAGMVTAKQAGGDLYDFFLIRPDRLAFVVADACGKGLPAAIFITLTRTLLRAAARRLAAPGDCLRTVNAMLCIDNAESMFTTAFFGILDTTSGRFEYANAGHPPPYILRADGRVEPVRSQGTMPLGVFDDVPYTTGSLELAAGESLVCYSDGVTEAIGPDGGFFGDDRLIRTLSGKTGAAVMETAIQVVADVDQYIGTTPMADDITVLALRYFGNPA